MPQQPTAPAKPKPIPVPPPQVDAKYGSAEQIMRLPLARLVALLDDPAASTYAKAKACQQLALVGDATAVPALARLLADPQLSHYARFALEPIPGAAADEALREAAAKTQGRLLVGIVNSIAQRRDRNAIALLARLRTHTDREIAQAAETALARIRPVP